jgi:hypothetical protein
MFSGPEKFLLRIAGRNCGRVLRTVRSYESFRLYCCHFRVKTLKQNTVLLGTL